MNDFDMNNFGTPSDGVEEFRKRFYGELEGGGNQQAGGLVADTHTPSADSVVNRVDWADAARKSLQRDEERTKRVHGLRGLVLYDKDEAFRNAVSEHNDLSFMVDDRVRADKPGFNMLLGGELSRTLGDGDTFGVLNQTIDALPSEQQLDAKARMQKCDTEYKAKELLGELWSGLIVKDYEDQKAEAEKKVADMKAARAEWQKVYEAKGLDRMMKGLDIPLEMRDMVMLERAGLRPEAINEVRATHQRASKAWDKLMRWMYGTSYSQAKMKARVVGEALKKGWDDELHLPWTEKPTDEDFYQQGAAELSESFDMSREQMAELLQTMRDENGQLDKQAMAMFLMAMEKEAASTQTVIHSKFWRNFGEAVADWARETGDFLYKSRYNSIINNPLTLNTPLPTQVFLWLQGEEAMQEYIEEVQRTQNADVETLKGWMTRFDKKRVEAAERADFLTDLSTDSGTTWGASTPMIVANTAIPGWGGMIAGAAVSLPAMTNEALSENYAKGVKNPALMAGIEGVMQTGAEGLFMAGASKLPFVGQVAKKLTGWAGMKAKAIDLVGKMVGATQGRAWARYGLGVAAETFGEIVVEDFVAETGTYATVKVLRAMGANLAEPEWEPFENVLKTMQDPGQTGATIGLCAALGLLGIPGNARAARSFAADRKMLLQVGLTEGGIAEVQHELKEFEGRVSKALAEAKPRLSEVRAEAEAKAVAEAEAKAGRPLSEEELAEAKKTAGDKAVAEEVEKIRDREQEPLNEKMRDVFKRDVLHADPVAVKKRMEERGKKFLEDVELKMYADSKVMDYVLRKSGVLVGEQTSEGKYKVALKGDKEGETHEVEWTEEQLKAYVAMEHTEGQLAMMRELQARVAGEALAKADRSIGGELVNLADTPIRALARMERNGGRVDYAVLKDLAEDARDKIGGFVTEGMSWTEASAQMSEIPGVTLGTLANTADAFVKRVDEAFATGEAQELGLTKPEDAATNVFRVNKAGSAGQSILLYNRGKMNEREFVEDHIERDVVAAVEGENATTSWEALETMLKRVDAEMVKNGGTRLFKKGATGKGSVIEAFSSLAQSYFLLNHWNYTMSAEAHATIEYVQKNLKGAQYLMTLSHAWDAFSQSKEGKEYIQKEGASLEKLLSDAGASVAGKYAAAKMDADSAAVVLEAYESSSMASVKLAMEEAAKADAEQSKAREAEPTEIPASESITGEALPLEAETEEVAEKAEPVELDERGQRMKDAEDRMKDGRATVVDVAYYFRTSGMTLAEAEERGLVSRNEDGELSSVYTLGMKLAADASDDTVNGLVEGSVDLKDAVVATTAATTESGQQVALQALAEGKSVEETTALVRVGEKLAGQEDVAELMAEDAEFKARVEETAKNVAAERAVLQEQIAKAETADEAKALAEQDAALERGEVEALSEQEAETKADEGGTFSLASDEEVVRVTAEEAPADKAALIGLLKKLAGQKFTNKAKQMSATVSAESAKKIARAEQETVANLKRLGYTEEEAGVVHRAAAMKIGELYERAELYIEEEVYHKTDDRKAAWHFFEPVTVELKGREETFLTNISVIDYTRGGERIFSLELTIENPISNAEGMAAPTSGRQALHTNGVSDVRLAAFQSFVKKEKTKIERKSREKGLIPWRVDEARLNELRGEESKVQKEIDALLAKFGGDETKLQNYRRDRIKLHDLREQLAKKQALIAAEYKPEGMPDVRKPKAPNGKDSNLPLDLWLTVRTKAFKAWFGDWENDPANASKVVDENGEPKVVTHATNSEPFTVFKRGERAGLSGKGIYFSPDGVGIWGKNVMHCFLNVRNPLTKENAPREVNNGGMSAVDPDVFEHFPQFDGVMLRKDEITVRDPNQIKSATDNRGTFDGNNADITFSIAMEIQDNLLKQEFSSKDTSINSTKAPAVFGAVEKKLGGWKSGTVNVDIGGGRFDTLTDKLAEKGVTNFIYEPFGRTIEHNAYILGELRERTTLGDTATCSNVLNVIKEAEIRANVIHQVAKAIKADGVAYFTIYEGDRTGNGKRTKDDCWQENRKTATYVEEVKRFFGDVELKGGVIVARTPLHVNEPAVWKLGSDSETDFATFSLSANLAAVHTLSTDKFLKAVELGGMPLPSVAVTRLDRPYGWGGASSINLIGRPSMVDPAKGTSVYSADAWAGKYPRTEHKRANKEDFERTMESADELTKRYGNLYMSIRGRMGQKLDPEELRASLESEDGKALFAAVSGYFPKPKMKAARSHHPYFDKQFAKETKNMWEGDGIVAGQEIAFADAVEAALERFLAKQGRFADIYRKLHAEDVEKLRSQGAETAFLWWQMRRSYENIGKQELDGTATHAAIIAYANKHKKAYQKWVAEKVEAWLTKEAYISDNGKEATLENVTAYMLKNKGLNKEKFPGFNEGKLRAARSTRMRSIADIQARRESLSDSKTSTDSKLVTNAKLRGFTSRVRAVMDRMSEDGFYASDYGLEALSKVKGKPTVEGVKEGLRKVFSYRPKLLQALLEDVDLVGCGVDALESLRAEVEDYMEAVPNRAVLMDEWQYAVMPENLRKNKAVQKALRENGIKAVYHDGTMAGRDAALAGLVGNERVSFSLAGRSALDGRVELNAVTAKDPTAREYMRNVMLKKHKFTKAEVDGLFALMDGIVSEAEGMYEEYPVFKAWNERDADRYKKGSVGIVPKLSAFKANGDYKFNIDLGTLCAKREAMDWLLQIMAKESRLGNLGSIQIERLKDLLRSKGLATACDVCFVEAKRYRLLPDSVKTSFYWRAVCEAVGITDSAPVGTPRVLTAEQDKRLRAMADNKRYEAAYRKYVLDPKKRVESYDLGLTPSMMNKLAKLFLQDSSLMGVLEPMRLMTTYGMDELLRNYGRHTKLEATLAGLYGSATAKPLEGFLVYDPLSWRKDFDSKKLIDARQKIYSIGGGRAQSFTDFSAVLFLDYVQMVADFEARRLPLHVYTKVPAFVKLFGRTGIMVNMSFVPEIVEGVDAEHAGLKRGENGEWEYAWSEDSFPVDDAYALREREDFGGRVGIIAVGVSDAHIQKLLDDSRIDMVIPYHASGMPVIVKNKTGLRYATDYTEVQTTRPKEGGKRKAKWSYNTALKKLKDPRKAAKAYLDWCDKNGFIPKFEQFREHPNYYKLLEDFRGYDNAGNGVIQGAVRLNMPEDWQEVLSEALTDRQELQNTFSELEKDKDFLNKARKILKYQPLDGKVREVMMARLKSALPGKDSVQSLTKSEFLDKLEEVLAAETSADDAKARVEVYRKGDGVIYGFAHRGTIYLNENTTNANTPAHEFTHVWAKVAQNVNDKLWKKGVELLNQTEEWQEVLEDPLYENIRGDDNAVASEVLARLAGKENEAFVRMLVDPDSKPLEKKGIIAQVMEWLGEMWKSVRSIFDAPGGKKLTLQEFSRMPIKDLWDETRNKQFAEAARDVLGKSAEQMRAEINEAHAEASFSLSGPSMLDAAPTGRMAGEQKMQRLLNYARKEAARWGRTFGKDIPTAKAAEAMGTVSSLLASINKELPPKYRPQVDANMRYVEVYARLIESGKVRTYGKLSKEERAAVEAELMDVLREEQQRVEEEYEQAKAEAMQTAALTGEMAALEEAENMDVEDEVQRAAYLERVAKRAEAETRKRLLAEAEAKKKKLDAEVEALKREFGAEKLAEIAQRMLSDAANSMERYLIDDTLDLVPTLMERLAPKKLPNGKYDKGKMSADGYRKLVRYVEMIDSTAEEVSERMEALGLQIAAEEAKSDKEKETVDGDKLEALQAELAEWSTYGNLRGKRLDAVRAGVQALVDFAAYEKNAWQGMLQLKRARIKRQALKAAEALGGANEYKVKDVVEAETNPFRKGVNLLMDMQSLSQMFYAMGGVPELRALADESLDALSAGHVALTMREKRAYEQLAEYMKKEMGLDTENKRNDFMASLKKLHNTGIIQEGEIVRHRLKLDPQEAAMWLAMTKEERDEKRAEMEAEANKREVLVENVPFEEDIPLIREALDKFNEKPAGKKWIHTERVFRRPAATEPMKLSKDEALNILLLCEQDDYVDAAADNGYTAEVQDQLREFVGADVLAFGYAMREVLENNGLAEVYEAREGVPFPKVANYWPGNFDQSARANEQANALDPTSGNGTRYGMLITRVKHNLKFNILGATNVFMAALAQQNNYICIGELTAKWRGLLSHSDFAMSLKAHMGDHSFKKLKEFINLLDGAGVQESVTQQSLSGLTAIFQQAHAMAVLAGSPITLVKQLSAMFNAGAWQGISMWRVAARLLLDRIGKGAIRYDEMLKKDYFQARYKDNRYFTEMLQLGRNANWSRLSKYARGAMNLIEGTDVATNCFAMTALYNITYHDLKQRNKDAVDPLTEAEMHAECDRVVRNTLDLGAQPLRRTQKSAFVALSRTSFVRSISYMGSESINKIGMTLATMKREGGGAKGLWKAWKYVAGMSFAQQLIIMALDMARGADPVDDDEWAKWALLNLATGATGLGILQTIPMLGEFVQWGSGGYLKTGSMGEMVYDYGGLLREMKKGWDLIVFNSEDSVEIKKSRKSPYWEVTYKKQDGSRVTTSTDVPVEGGEFEGVQLSKDEAEAKALEVGKRIAEEDAPGWADWGMMGANLLRYGAAFTGAWKGINSTSKVMSELSGMLQSLNAVANTVRPFMQAERNEEKRVKEYNTKLEKGFREARKKTNERLKKQREEEKKKKDAAKKREDMLKKL